MAPLSISFDIKSISNKPLFVHLSVKLTYLQAIVQPLHPQLPLHRLYWGVLWTYTAMGWGPHPVGEGVLHLGEGVVSDQILTQKKAFLKSAIQKLITRRPFWKLDNNYNNTNKFLSRLLTAAHLVLNVPWHLSERLPPSVQLVHRGLEVAVDPSPELRTPPRRGCGEERREWR